MRQPTDEINRPKLAEWMFRRGLTLARAGAMFGCSGEMVRLMCLPFEDKRRRVPSRELADLIAVKTDFAIAYADFFDPTPSLTERLGA